MPRRQRKKKKRREDVAAYREMVGKILAGEVRKLYWSVKRRMVPADARAGMIYVWDPDSRTERVVTAGSLRHFRVQSAKCRMQSAEQDRMNWVKE